MAASRGQKAQQMIKRGRCHRVTVEVLVPAGVNKNTALDDAVRYGLSEWIKASETYIKSLRKNAVLRAYL
jgi:hypothetical protein